MKHIDIAAKKLQIMTLLDAEPQICFEIAKEFKVSAEDLLKTYITKYENKIFSSLSRQNKRIKYKTYRKIKPLQL